MIIHGDAHTKREGKLDYLYWQQVHGNKQVWVSDSRPIVWWMVCSTKPLET